MRPAPSFAAAAALALIAVPIPTAGGEEPASRPEATARLEPAGERLPIVKNVFLDGATGAISAGELGRKTGIVAGAPLRVDLVRKAIRELYATGAFRSVEATIVPTGVEGEVDLVFRVLDRLLLSDIVVSGNKKLPREEIIRVARLPADAEIDVSVAETVAERVRERYVLRGFHEAAVKASIVPMVDPTRVRLLLEVKEGPPTVIERIVFSGRPAASPAELVEALPKGLRPGKPLDVTLFRSAREALRRDLRLRGHYDAAAREPTYDVDKERHRAVLTIPVEAGPLYLLEFEGNEILTDTALRLRLVDEDPPDFVAPLHSADKDPGPLDERVRERLVEKLKRRYEEIGFLLADIRVEMELTDVAPSPRVPESAAWDRDEERVGTAAPEAVPVKRLRFVIDEGRPVKLLRDATGIAFAGNEHIDGATLRKHLTAVVREKLKASEKADYRAELGVDARVPEASGRGDAPYAPERERLVPVLDKEVYVPELFDEGTKSLLDLYRSEGYWDVEIDPPAIALDPEGGFVALTITIREGERQLLREVLFDGNESVDDKSLLVESRLELDGPLSPLALEEARVRILELYAENGFLYAEVDYEVARLPESTSIAVYRVSEGPRVLVAGIEVRGLDATVRAVVTGRLEFDIGGWVRPSKLRESERELLALGVFTAVSIELEDPEHPEAAKKIVVTVVEDKFLSFETRVGWSTDDGPRALLRAGYSNLFGRAWTLTGTAQVNYPLLGLLPALAPELIPPEWPDHPGVCPPLRGRSDWLWPGIEKRWVCIPGRVSGYDAIERRISVGFRFPQLFTLFVPFDVTAEVIHSRKTELAYGLTEYGGRISATTSLLAEFALRADVDVFNDTYVTYSAEALGTLPPSLVPQLFPDSVITLLSARTVATWDFRDNRFNATKGLLATLKLDYVVSLRDGRSPEEGVLRPPIRVHALRTEVLLNGYVPIPWPRGAVLAFSSAFGAAIPIARGEAIPPDRAFFLGGRNTLRGYYEQELIPDDIVQAYEPCDALDPACDQDAEVKALRTPARAYVLHRTEYRFPLFRSGFDVGLFVDIGNSWASLTSFALAVASLRGRDPDVKFNLLVNPGVGFRYPTPIGPISFEVGCNSTRRPTVLERGCAFHFSIGVF